MLELFALVESMDSWFFLSVFPAELILVVAGPEGAKNLAGENVLRLIRIRLATPSLQKISPACQANSPQVRIADSSSRNAVSFLFDHDAQAGWLLYVVNRFSVERFHS